MPPSILRYCAAALGVVIILVVYLVMNKLIKDDDIEL